MSSWVAEGSSLFSLDFLAPLVFGLALLHTFAVGAIRRFSHRFQAGSLFANGLHLLAEVEVVFGFWAALYLFGIALILGLGSVQEILEATHFTEPVFVFVIMTVCSTRPILSLVERGIAGLASGISRLLKVPRSLTFYAVALTLGPLLGSFITEPAAMTVIALLLFRRYFQGPLSKKLKYATLGLLFVNISIGGVLTPYAAPPVLMVASKWNWDLSFMLTHFGWKGFLASSLSTVWVLFRFRKELAQITEETNSNELSCSLWVSAGQVLFLMGIVLTSHSIPCFMLLFLFFLGYVQMTASEQSVLKWRESVLVGFFLAGLVVLGKPQAYWLEPLLAQLSSLSLYLGAISLTAVTDNAALTYLGSQVPGLIERSQYLLVAGSVVGGGLTVIANAPNPAGYGILSPAFGEEGIRPLDLFLAALCPTLIAGCCFWFL